MPNNVKERRQGERSATGMNGGAHALLQSPAPRPPSRDEVAYSVDQVLGLLLLEPSYSRVVELPIGAFADPAKRALYHAIIGQYAERETFDLMGVVAHLRDLWVEGRSALDVLGGYAGLATLTEGVEPTQNIGYHASIVRQAYETRQAEMELRAALTDLGAGEPVGSVLDRLHERLARRDEVKSSRFELLSSSELATTDFRVDYLIDGIIVKGQPHGWGGPSKGMKTSTALDAAISMATGGHFLGLFPAKQVQGVLFISGESGLPTLKETAERICDAAGRRLQDIDRLHWCTDLPRLDSVDDIGQLRNALTQCNADVLFLDPLYLCMPGDNAGNMFSMGEHLRRLSAMTEQAGVTPILLHHTTRQAGKEFEPLELTSLAWAGISEFCRAWVLVNRRERYEEGSGLHRLWMSAGGSAGHSGCWAVTIEEGCRGDIGGRVWRTQVLSRSEAVSNDAQQREAKKEYEAEQKRERDFERFLTAIQLHPDGTTKRDLQFASGLRPAPFNEALARAMQEGRIQATKIQRANGQCYAGFKPVQPVTADH